MTLSEEIKDDSNHVEWNVFYVGEHGFGEHLQVRSRTSRPIIEGRAKLLDWLKEIGAKPQPRDIPFASKVSTPRGAAAPVDPMLAAAQQTFGSAVGKNCVIHGTAMKRIGGTAEHGRLSKTGKSYNAFWVCESAPGCRGGE
jgi:hypothetical protein